MLVAGVDEVGRGPLAGPVVAAAVIFPSEGCPVEGLRDSKKLSEKERSRLEPLIKKHALSWAIAEASVEEIDQLNILQATFVAMQRAVAKLGVQPNHVLVDGNRGPKFATTSDCIVKGDDTHDCIAAASIIAKQYRDHLMRDYAKIYPGYGFETNSGYPTNLHRAALKELGVTSIHRRSFKPVALAIKK